MIDTISDIVFIAGTVYGCFVLTMMWFRVTDALEQLYIIRMRTPSNIYNGVDVIH